VDWSYFLDLSFFDDWLLSMGHRIGVKEMEWLDGTLLGLNYVHGLRQAGTWVWHHISREVGVEYEVRARPGKKLRCDPDALDCDVGFFFLNKRSLLARTMFFLKKL
jgi:hypothetical protein